MYIKVLLEKSYVHVQFACMQHTLRRARFSLTRVEQEVFSGENFLSRNEHEEGCILRKKLVLGSVQGQKHLTIPSQKTFRKVALPYSPRDRL
jgi:hypothetical protein